MYETHQRARTGSEATAAFARAALLPLSTLYGDQMAASLRERHFAGLLDAHAGLAMATRRSYWRLAVRASAWFLRRGLVGRDVAQDLLRSRARRDDPLPWETPAGSKSIGRGKVQLRNQAECAAYLDAAIARRDPHERIAAVLPLLCGMRSGEVLHLRAADVDVSGGVLWIRGEPGDGWDVKTSASSRSVEIPGCLRADLAAVAQDAGDGLLFRQHAQPGDTPERAARRASMARCAYWLRDLVRDVCDAAKVRMVTPHGLRGTHATLMRVVAGRAVQEIAAALGHADRGQTVERHYTGAPGLSPALRVVGGKEDAHEL